MNEMKAPRRGFLEAVMALLAGLMAAVVGVPIVAAFLDPLRRESAGGGGGTPAPYGKVKDLPVGVPRRLEVVSVQRDAWNRSEPKPIGAVWLVRRSDERVDAYSVVCPHLGCPVGYDADKAVFACPCHESGFSLADGSRLKGPAPRGLDALPVQITDGTIHVTYQRFVIGIPARRQAT